MAVLVVGLVCSFCGPPPLPAAAAAGGRCWGTAEPGPRGRPPPQTSSSGFLYRLGSRRTKREMQREILSIAGAPAPAAACTASAAPVFPQQQPARGSPARAAEPAPLFMLDLYNALSADDEEDGASD